MRNIVQIAATQGNQDYYPALYVLCEDGSLWVCKTGVKDNFEWTKLPDVPNGKKRKNGNTRTKQ